MKVKPHSYRTGVQTLDAFVVCLHAGISMEPTLHAADILAISPYHHRPVRVGDVIFFLPPDSKEWIVHRVVKVTPEGIRTRGDNNVSADPFLLKPVNIVGQVIAAWQGQRRRKIRGGWRGRVWAESWHWSRPISRKGYTFLRHHVKGEHVIKWLRTRVRTIWRPRILVFQADQDYSAKLLLGTRVIGHYTRSRRAWHIHQPFRLFIDPHTLPIL